MHPKTKWPENICLAIIWQVQTNFPNVYGMLLIPYYLQTGALNPADIKSIQCVVSHIEDHRKWGLINCSGLLAHAVFTEAD